MIDWWEKIRESKTTPLGKHTIDLDKITNSRIHVSPKKYRGLIALQLFNIRVLQDLLKNYIDDLKLIYGDEVIDEAVKVCATASRGDTSLITDLAKRISDSEMQKELECDQYRIEEELNNLG